MKVVIGNRDDLIADWVAKRIRIFEFGSSPYTAIGLMNEAGVILAGVIYQNFTHRDIQVHVAAVPGKRWMSRHFLGEIFRYPFEQLGVHRVTGLIPAHNTVSQEFAMHLGFKREGRVREMLEGDEDLIVYGMLKSECRHLEVGRYGHANRFQPFPASVSAA